MAIHKCQLPILFFRECSLNWPHLQNSISASCEHRGVVKEVLPITKNIYIASSVKKLLWGNLISLFSVGILYLGYTSINCEDPIFLIHLLEAQIYRMNHIAYKLRCTKWAKTTSYTKLVFLLHNKIWVSYTFKLKDHKHLCFLLMFGKAV